MTLLVLIILIKLDSERENSLSLRQTDWSTKIMMMYIINAIGFIAVLAYTQNVPKHDWKYLATMYVTIFFILVDGYVIVDMLIEGL